MSTSAQVAANRSNAQHSTGPKTEAGKAAVSQNNLRHGFSGVFVVMAWENHDAYQSLLDDLTAEHQPATLTEYLLVEKMAQSHWLRARALLLQDLCLHSEAPICNLDREKDLALFLRYQTTHERAFYKALGELLKLRNEKRKAEIGFESQKQKEADEGRRAAQETRHRANENRKQELHKLAVQLAEVKITRQQALTSGARPPSTAQQAA